MAAEHLKGLSARDLLVGLVIHLPVDCTLHQQDIVTYIIERFDISAKDIKDELAILCGENYHPKILKFEKGYYTIIPEAREEIKKFIKYNEEQLKGLEKMTSGILIEASLDYR